MDQLFNGIAAQIGVRAAAVPELPAVPEELNQYLAPLDYSAVSKCRKVKSILQTSNHDFVPKIIILEQGKLGDKYVNLLVQFLDPTHGFQLNSKMRTSTLNVCILENIDGVITHSLMALSGTNNFASAYVAARVGLELQGGVKVILVPPVTHPQLHEHYIPWLQLFCMYYRKYRNNIPELNVALDGVDPDHLLQIRSTLDNIRTFEADQHSVLNQVYERYKAETLAKFGVVDNNEVDVQKLELELCLLEPAQLFIRSILVASDSFQEEKQALLNSNIEIQTLRSSVYQSFHDYFEANLPAFAELREACTTAISYFRLIPLLTVYTKMIQPCAEDNFLGLLAGSPVTLQLVRAAHSVKIFSLSKHRQQQTNAPTSDTVKNAVIPPCRGCQLHFPHDLCRVIAPEGVNTTYSIETVLEEKFVEITPVRTPGESYFDRERGVLVTDTNVATHIVERGTFVRAREEFPITKAPPA